MLQVIDVRPLAPYRLLVSFSDGIVREVNCEFLLHGSLGEPLHDPDYFRQVSVDPESRTITWPNGLDPAPELLHDPDRIGDLRSGRPPRAAA